MTRKNLAMNFDSATDLSAVDETCDHRHTQIPRILHVYRNIFYDLTSKNIIAPWWVVTDILALHQQDNIVNIRPLLSISAACQLSNILNLVYPRKFMHSKTFEALCSIALPDQTVLNSYVASKFA